MNKVEYLICQTQGKIFKYAVKKGYDMQNFAEKFLSSEFCEEAFDTIYSRYQLDSPMESADFFMPELREKLKLSPVKQDKEEAAYIGFIYRYLYFVTKIKSKDLIQKVPFEEVQRHFINSNLRTEDFVVEDICNDYGLPIVGELEICF